MSGQPITAGEAAAYSISTESPEAVDVGGWDLQAKLLGLPLAGSVSVPDEPGHGLRFLPAAAAPFRVA